jgi:hypothetical protein
LLNGNAPAPVCICGSNVMKVKGIENLTLGDLIEQVRQGGRFVLYHWVIGAGVKTIVLPSGVRFVRPGERAGRGVWRSIATVVTGWWAIPNGPRATVASIRENLRGGRDVTASVLRTLAQAGGMGIKPAAGPPLTWHAA